MNARMWKTALVLALMIQWCIGVAVVNAVEDIEDLAQEQTLREIDIKLQKKVSVDFRETPIDDVIRVLTKQAGVDVVKNPNVVGNITATITDVPLSEALENILAAHSYAYIATDSMLRIVPRSEITVVEEKRFSKVYRITYANAADLAKALKDFISKEGEIAVNPGTSNIMVTDTEAKLGAIDEFILEVDRITPQIMVEVRIFDISFKDREDIGVNWFAGTNTTFNSAGMASGGKTNSFQSGSFTGTTSFTETADAVVRFGILNDNLDIDAILKAEQERITAKLLANPRIMVLDNEEALIKIISEIPYQELTQTAGGGNIGTTEFKDVGVELRVVPHLTRAGMIRLHINPIFSVQTGEVAIGIGASSITSPQPVVDKREANTIALVQDRQTVVLGGMRKQDKNTQLNKVPFFGDIPLVGGLFRFEGEELVTSELVVFITPMIIENPDLSEVEELQLQATNIEPQLPDPEEDED